MGRKSIIVGSRGSRLALLQTNLVVQQLKQGHPDLEFRVKKIKTKGDRDLKSSLDQIGGEGVFVKELEEALSSEEIDMAVHSLKDMPTELSPKFMLAAAGMRVDARDALVSESGKTLSELPKGSRIATGSQRRAAQLRAFRPDFQIRPLRGNIDTRLNKLHAGELDGIIVGASAMIRMGLADKVTEYLPVDSFIPSVGQGAIAVEIKANDRELAELLAVVNDEETWLCTQAERAFLKALGGGCRSPIAALGTVSEETLHLKGMVANAEGSKILRASEKGPRNDPEEVGKLLAERLSSMGAQELIVR